MRLLLIIFICLGSIAFFVAKKKEYKVEVNKAGTVKSSKIKADEKNESLLRIRDHAATLKAYLSEKSYNKEFCFLVDMKIPSGRNRFFVYSLSGDSIITSGLTTHGSGSQTETAALSFSNKEGSNATSLGKYKIGEKYSGKFGTAYKLFGLDKTNSNAYVRAVVLHSHPYVPAQEVYPQLICLSWGCPTVSPSYLKVLEKYIDNSSKPIMLWIYY
jgi:hypothetical protein